MRHADPPATGLTRRSADLTEAHKQLIRLLAERAVEDYLREVEATDARDPLPEAVEHEADRRMTLTKQQEARQ